MNRTPVRETISEAARCGNTSRPLARSTSTEPKDGLAMKATGPCSTHDCAHLAWARGLCSTHYSAARRSGALKKLPGPSLQERFWAKVNKTDTCWLWTAATNGVGYGVVSLDGKMVGAHRLSLEWAQEHPIPPGMVVDHKCHVTECVNPEHLQAVTVSANGENRVGPSVKSKTGVRGVYWLKNRFEVRVKSRGAQYNGGRFATLAEAEAAAVALRNRLMINNLTDRKSA